MKFQDVIGIDIGKLKNESIIHSNHLTLEFDNNNAGFKKMISWVEKHSTCPIKRIMFAFEHTGIYSFPRWAAYKFDKAKRHLQCRFLF